MLILEATGPDAAPRRRRRGGEPGRSEFVAHRAARSVAAGGDRAALRVAELDGSRVATLQMHGTGTALGDPIEIGSALAVFERRGRAVARARGGEIARRPHRDGGGRRRRRATPREFGASRRRSRRASHRGQRPRAERASIGARRSRRVERRRCRDKTPRSPDRARKRRDVRRVRIRVPGNQRTRRRASRRREGRTSAPRRRVGRRAVRRRSRSVLGRPEAHASLREARAAGKSRRVVAFGPRTTRICGITA